jgi:hypothetical protein
MIVTIGQPGLFPWWGTFAKAALSDVFIHLDHVTWQKGGYLNRFFLMGAARGEWCTIPLRGAHLGASIDSLELGSVDGLAGRHVDKARRVLGPCRGDAAAVNALVSDAYGVDSVRVVDAAATSTELVAAGHGIGCEFRRSSELQPADRSTAMLVDLIKKVGGNAYLFGPGKGGRCQQYLDVVLMKRAGIQVGMATYGARDRASIIQDLWLGRDIAPSSLPMSVEWL